MNSRTFNSMAKATPTRNQKFSKRSNVDQTPTFSREFSNSETTTPTHKLLFNNIRQDDPIRILKQTSSNMAEATPTHKLKFNSHRKGDQTLTFNLRFSNMVDELSKADALKTPTVPAARELKKQEGTWLLRHLLVPIVELDVNQIKSAIENWFTLNYSHKNKINRNGKLNLLWLFYNLILCLKFSDQFSLAVFTFFKILSWRKSLIIQISENIIQEI